jgi:hypothetical protein
MTLTQPEIDVRTFGLFSITQRGRPIHLPGVKDRALFAYLAVLKDQVHRRDRLADLLWPDQPEARARHSLNQALYQIRRLLPNILRTDIHTVAVIESTLMTDVDRVIGSISSGKFLHVAELVKGEFLNDLDVRYSQPFDEWRGSYARNLMIRIEQSVVKELHDLESDSAAAQSLKIPQFLLESLALQVLPAPLVSNPPVPTVIPPDDNRPLPLVGRELPLLELNACWRDALHESTNSVVVLGPAGIGKTRLVEEFIDKNRSSEIRILATRCYQSERRIGFGPIMDILAREITQEDYSELDALWRAALGHVFPQIQGSALSLPRLSASGSKTRIFEAFLQLLKHMSKTSPTVLFVDDIQWADKSSTALLSYLSNRLRGASVMIVATMRLSHRPLTLPASYNRWKEIRLAELAEKDVTALIRQFDRSEEIGLKAQQLFRMTGGNPCLLREVVLSGARHGMLDGRSSVGRKVTENSAAILSPMLSNLPTEVDSTLGIMAVIGRPVSLTLLKRMLPNAPVAKAVNYLVGRGVVSFAKNRIFFQHDLIREVAYTRLPSYRRQELHLCVADVMRTIRSRSGEAAAHYYRARVRHLAHKYALEALRDADRRYATDEGISFLKLAIKSGRSVDRGLYRDLATRLCSAHRMTECRKVVKRAFRDLASNDEPNRLELDVIDLEAAYGLGEIEGVPLRSALGQKMLEVNSASNDIGMRILRLQVRSAYHDGDSIATNEILRELKHYADRSHGPSNIEALALYARMHSLMNSASQAESWVAPLWNEAEDLLDHELRLRVRLLMGVILYEVGKLSEAETLHWQLLREIDSTGAISQYPLAAIHTHMLLVEQGKYTDAANLASIAKERVSGIDPVQYMAPLAANEAAMYYELGDLPRAATSANEAVRLSARTKAVWIETGCIGIRGLIAIAQDQMKDAVAAADVAKRIIADCGKRVADVSHAEILISRVDSRLIGREAAASRLRAAIDEYQDRDILCRLRMEVELARVIKGPSRSEARNLANRVFREASRIEARPIAEKADALLLRL